MSNMFKITLKDRLLMTWYWILSFIRRRTYYSHSAKSANRDTDIRLKKQEKYIWRLLMDNDIKKGHDSFYIGDIRFHLDTDHDLMGVVINDYRFVVSRSIEVLSKKKYTESIKPVNRVDEQKNIEQIIDSYTSAKGL